MANPAPTAGPPDSDFSAHTPMMAQYLGVTLSAKAVEAF